jgi:predicted ATPase
MIQLLPGKVPGKTTIRRLRIKGMHGYMDKDIRFNSNINLLVGINGSGKTSVLNVINWLLQPAIPQLCTTEFKEIVMDLIQDRARCRIRCVQTTTEVRLYLQTSDSKKYNPLVVQLQRPPGTFRNSSDQREMLDAYSSLQPDKKEQRAWGFLQQLPSPIVVGLERTLGSDSLELHISAAKTRSLGHTGITPPAFDPPLVRVQRLAVEGFGRYRTKLIQLNDELRDKITLAAFDIGGLSPKTNRTKSEKLLNEAQITALEGRVEQYFAQESRIRPTAARAKSARAAVAAQYFAKLKNLVRRSRRQGNRPGRDPIRQAIIAQFRKTNRLFADFEQFDAETKEAFAEVQRYLRTVNRFLQDSGKQLDFDFDTGILRFQMLKRGTSETEVGPRNLELLSSGEKQIVILFTYLAFNPGKIFIIDEPELSLHPRWQEEFLPAVEQVMPSDTQLIIATHSPAIVGKQVAFCKTLLPYNS